MLSVTNDFRRQLKLDNRNYVVELRNFTLGNGTILPTIDNEKIWDGGVSFSESTSDTSKFNIGSAVIGSCTIILDNIKENFSSYDFFNATFDLFIGLSWIDEDEEVQTELIKRGHYTVDSASYNGSLITLSCLDNMWKFDKPFSEVSGVNFPISARNLINSICMNVGVTLDTQSFPNYSTLLPVAPKNEMNCREIMQYAAQVCGCYCKINVNGDLTLGWYDVDARESLVDTDGGSFNTTTTPYSDGANVNGGTFAYNDGDNLDGGLFTDSYDIAYLSSNSQMEVGTDDIEITGIRVYSNEKDAEYDVTVGSAGYVLEIEENPFIIQGNSTAICNQIFNQCDGLVIRTFTAQSLSDISIEAGDICYVCDFRGNRFVSYITNLSFTTGSYESFSCGAESPQKNLTTRYNTDVQTYVQAQRAATEQIGVYDVAVQRMNMLASNMMGCYFAEKKDSNGGTICYSSNKPFTYDSQGNVTGCTSGSTVWKRNDQGYFISTSGGTNLDSRSYASGIDNSGNVTAQSLATIGLSADWINAGQVSADRMETNVIRAINSSTSLADYLTFTFDSQSQTESANYDYVKIYYYRNSTGKYYVSQALGGSIGGYSYYFSLPSDVNSIYVMWHSDSSTHNFYGFKFSAFGSGTRGSYLSFTEQSSSPTSASASYVSSWGSIQTSHPYSDNQDLAWYFSTPNLVIDGAKININGNVTFSNLYDGLANGTTVINGGCIQTGTLSADRIEGGTLKIGGYNDTKGVIELYNEYNDVVGRWDNEGLVSISEDERYGTYTCSQLTDGGLKFYRDNSTSSSYYLGEIASEYSKRGGIRQYQLSVNSENTISLNANGAIWLNASGGDDDDEGIHFYGPIHLEHGGIWAENGQYGIAWSGYIGDRYFRFEDGLLVSVD